MLSFRFSRRLTTLSILLSCCLILLLNGGCNKKQPRWSAFPPGTTVLAFGDSITAGTGAGFEQDYPTQLATLTGWKIINAGVPGELALNGKNRIETLLSDYHPALVLIESGGNDFLRQRNHQDIALDLRDMIAQVRRHQAQPVLIAVPAASLIKAAAGKLSDAHLYQEIASTENIPIISNVLTEILSTPDLRADTIHPNANGYQKLASGIAHALKEQGLLAAIQSVSQK